MCIEILGPHNCHGPQGGPLLFIAISFSPLTDKWGLRSSPGFQVAQSHGGQSEHRIWPSKSPAGPYRGLEIIEDLVLLMAEIQHQLRLVVELPFLKGFIYPRWYRISSINSMTT